MKFGFTLIRIATPSTSLLVLTLFLAATFCLRRLRPQRKPKPAPYAGR